MAGIGWKLQRMLDRDSLSGTLGAFLTGAAVTSGPWLITTVVLVAMRIAAIRSGIEGITDVEQIITVVYALALVLGAPIDIAMSRYASDCLYQKRPEAIAAPLRKALAFTIVTFAAVGIIWMTALGVEWQLGLAGTGLLVVVGAQWLMLSAAGGLSSPGTVLRAFGLGGPVSVIAAVALSRSGMGALGYLYGFGAGQVVTLAVLLWGTFAALPRKEDESVSMFKALGGYRMLPLAAFAIHGGIWIDKLVVYLQSGGAAAQYAALAAFAWFTVVPTFAYVYVQVETGFYQRFRGFFGRLHKGASLGLLSGAAKDIERDAKRILLYSSLLQIAVALVALQAAPHMMSVVGMGASEVGTFRILVVGATFQAIALCATLLLYYFDLRREALIVSVTLLVANAGVTYMAGAWGLPLGTGYAFACALACALGVGLLRHRLGTLLRDTFQLQPYAVE